MRIAFVEERAYSAAKTPDHWHREWHVDPIDPVMTWK